MHSDDPTQLKALKPGMVVRFDINSNYIITPKSVRPARLVVSELPEERRLRIQTTFDEILRGVLQRRPVPIFPGQRKE